MGINIGEVEAVLAARDSMSPTLVAAAEKVRALKVELEALGPMTKENAAQIVNLNNQLAASVNAFQLAGEAQERQSQIAAQAAARSDALAAMQEKQAASATNAVTASSGVTAALNTQLTTTERLIAAQSTLGAQAGAQQAAVTSVSTRLSELYGTLGSVGVVGPALAGGGFSQNLQAQLAAAKPLTDEMYRLEASLRAMTSAQYVANLQSQALAQGSQAAAASLAAVGTAAGSGGGGAAAGLNAAGGAAAGATGNLSQMDRVVTRMIERLAVLYAIRLGYEFVKDIFSGADALVRLSEQSDLSLERLQELQFGSQRVGVDFTKTTTAIDFFDKQLSGVKATAADALAPLHLSFSQLFALNPDERLDAVFKAIAALPSQLQRTQAEVKLFGTDAIDPLIKQYEGLKSAAHDANAILGDESVRVLAGTAAMYRQLWSDVSPVLENFIVKWQQLIGLMAAPIFGGNDQGIWRGIGAYFTGGAISPFPIDQNKALPPYSRPQPGDIFLPRDGAGQAPNTPTMGSARIAELKDEQYALSSLTDTQRQNLDWLREHNLLTADEAARQGLTTAQYREYEKAVRDAKTAHTELNRELKLYIEEQDRINGLWERYVTFVQNTAEGNAPVLVRDEMARARELSQAGGRFSEGKSDQWQLREEQDAVNMYWDAKEVEDRKKVGEQELRAWEKNEDDIQKIRDQSFAAEAETNLRGLDYQLAVLDRQEQQEKDSWKKKLDAGTVYDDQYWEAIMAIDDKFDNERARRAAKWESDKWEAIGQIEEQALAAEAGLRGRTVQAALAVNAQQLDATESRLAKQGKLDADYVAALERLYSDRAQSIIISFDPLLSAWRDLNGDMRNEWAATWDQAFEKGEGFAKAIEAPFLDIYRGFQKMLSGMIADWEYQLLSPMISSFRNAIGDLFNVANPNTQVGPGGGRFGLGSLLGSGGYVLGPNGVVTSPGMMSSVWETGGLGSTSTTGFAGPISGPGGPYVKGVEPGLGAGAIVGGGILTGIMAGTSGGSFGQQVGEVGLGAAAIGVESAVFTGAGIGGSIAASAATFGIGLGVIAAIAAIKYALHAEQRQIAEDAGKEFGEKWSEGLINKVKDVADLTGPSGVEIGVHAAEILSLPDIIKEHPVDTTNVDMYSAKLAQLFDIYQHGKVTVADAARELDAVFPQLADIAVDAYGRISDKLREVVALEEQMGIKSKAVGDYVKSQIEDAGSSFQAIVTSTLKGPHSREDVQALGQQLEMTFASEIAAGKDPTQVLKDLGPAIEQVRRAYASLGIAADDAALRQIFLLSKLNSLHPELMAGLDALIKQMVDFGNVSLETSDLFKSQERVGLDMWDKIQKAVKAAGGTQADALSLIQGFLHEVMDEAKQLGVPIDANIQALIDASKAAGVWQDKLAPHKSTMDAIDALIAKIDILIGKLTSMPGLIYNAFEGSGGAVGGAIDKVIKSIQGGQQGGSTTPGGSGNTGGAVGNIVIPPTKNITSGPQGVLSAAALSTPTSGPVVNVYVDARGSFQLYEDFGAQQLADIVGGKIVDNIFQNRDSLFTKSRAAHALSS